MITTTSEHCLLKEAPPANLQKSISDPLVKELTQLAFSTDSLPERARILYQQLRKMVGQPRLVTCLLGLQALAQGNDPAGARLLAAFLDANTPGARLIPRVHAFTNTRRVRLRLENGQDNAMLRNWAKRFDTLAKQGDERGETIPGLQPDASGKPGSEVPYPLLRRCLRYFVATIYRVGELQDCDRKLMVDLVSLEVDAYQERISHLASEIDPFRVSSVVRVIPLLSRADAEIRDLREFLGWITAGEYELAFHKRVPRAYEVMDNREREIFATAFKTSEDLAPLSALQTGLQRNAIPVPQLAGSVARLMALTHQLRLAGLRRTDMDLVTAVRIIQQHDVEGELHIPLSEQLEDAVKIILIGPEQGDGLSGWPLSGFELDKDELVLRLPGVGLGDRVWRNDLPVPAESDQEAATVPLEEDESQKKEDMQAAAIKRLVMNNIGSVSVLLGFLRNPKIVAIPGLVASVAQRCRAVQVLHTIASDRRLYTGFANKEVPLAILRSPCNIPVKTVRKFIHVKYISKVELRRMAKDKAGLRQEVVKEIAAYLKSLA